MQSVVAPATQLPFPSQVEAAVNPEPPQLAVRQMVLLPNFSQAPFPSQYPVLPHEVATPGVQALAGSATPEETTAQVPSGDEPVSLFVQA